MSIGCFFCPPKDGVCCGAFQERFALLRATSQKMSYFVERVISGLDFLKHEDILAVRSVFYNYSIRFQTISHNFVLFLTNSD